ncbi:hypothetical protein GIB67_012422 [Kingdonia uniflora]|uniref:Uncharacterized protein n=1 Tax=Kingdonia uniflora TaxID=39325 RepID=A0A7J7LLX7_9MAGN|nr:hypothetical protein GIB67_012422 [Kingdonia uniflora]
MPVKNNVTWTTMISSFAQHWEIEMCLELYHWIRCSALKPNDYTLTILISACTGIGVLGHGKNAHGQTIRMGFELCSHVVNVIIFMYSKKGFDIMELYDCRTSWKCPHWSPRCRQLVVLGARLRCNLLTACKFVCECRVLGQGMLNDKVNDILGMVDGLSDNMRRFGYVPNILEEGLDL